MPYRGTVNDHHEHTVLGDEDVDCNDSSEDDDDDDDVSGTRKAISIDFPHANSQHW